MVLCRRRHSGVKDRWSPGVLPQCAKGGRAGAPTTAYGSAEGPCGPVFISRAEAAVRLVRKRELAQARLWLLPHPAAQDDGRRMQCREETSYA